MILNHYIKQIKKYCFRDSYQFCILFGTALLPIFFLPNVSFSGPSDFYKKQEECTWSNARYFDDLDTIRYCVQKNGLIQSINKAGSISDEPGSFNNPVKVFRDDGYNKYSDIYEWKIESNQLILYACEGDYYSKNNFECIGSPNREVYGLDRFLNKRYYIKEATSLYNSNRFEEAIIYFSRAIELDPSNFYAHQMRGKSYFDLGEFNKGIIDIDKATSLDRNYIEGYKYLVIAKLFNNNYKGGVEMLDEVIETNSKDPNLLLYRGILRNHLGDSLGAKNDFDKALEIDSKYQLTYLYRSLLNASIGDFQNSLKDLQNYSEINFKGINTKCPLGERKELIGNSFITTDYLNLFEIVIADSSTVQDNIYMLIYAQKGRIKNNKVELFNGKIIGFGPNKGLSQSTFTSLIYSINLNKCNNIVSSM